MNPSNHEQSNPPAPAIQTFVSGGITYTAPQLQSQHEALIRASGIDDAIAAARGYKSVVTKAELRHLGFSDAQAQIEGLLIPIHGVDGNIVLHQFRPDKPRFVNAKPLKYEPPKGARMVLDVPPGARARLGDPAVPLFITEGVRKADSAVSHGLCAIDLLGVWNWRGKNERGGTSALADWERIALNGRMVYLCFDSDVMTKAPVYDAMVRLKAFLESKKASVQVVYLPPGSAGEKVGLDDFFASGHQVSDLLMLASKDLREPPNGFRNRRYTEEDEGLVYWKETEDGPRPVHLANFHVKIAHEVVLDDGVDETRQYKLSATVPAGPTGRHRTFMVPTREYRGLNWADTHLGAHSIIFPGPSIREHVPVAIKVVSGEPPERRLYAHTGWRDIDGKPAFLTAGGALGADGIVPGVSVSLPPALSQMILPEPPGGRDLIDAIRTSTRMLDVMPDIVTVPLFLATYRAPLGPADLTVAIIGVTGEGKSELAALGQQHFGAGYVRTRLPAAWSGTANANEGLLFAAKDVLCVIDDFAPRGSEMDVSRYHRDAERVIRAQGNQTGRARMRADASLKAQKPPRGLLLLTGEDVPRGESVRARMLVCEVPQGSMQWKLLGQLQKAGADGLYAKAMSGYIRWLAPQYRLLSDRVRDAVQRLRSKAELSGQHRRLPEILANLAVGSELFSEYAVAAGAFTPDEANSFNARCWSALGRVAANQTAHQGDSNPARRFIRLVGATISMGEAYVAGIDGKEPPDPGVWGWRDAREYSADMARWVPRGRLIGWIDVKERELYLHPEPAHAGAKKLARELGEDLDTTFGTIKRRLRDEGFLLRTDLGRDVFTYRKMVGGRRKDCLCLDPNVFGDLGYPPPDHPDQGGGGQGGSDPGPGGGGQSDHPITPSQSDGATPEKPMVGLVGSEEGGGQVSTVAGLVRSGESTIPTTASTTPVTEAGLPARVVLRYQKIRKGSCHGCHGQWPGAVRWFECIEEDTRDRYCAACEAKAPWGTAVIRDVPWNTWLEREEDEARQKKMILQRGGEQAGANPGRAVGLDPNAYGFEGAPVPPDSGSAPERPRSGLSGWQLTADVYANESQMLQDLAAGHREDSEIAPENSTEGMDAGNAPRDKAAPEEGGES